MSKKAFIVSITSAAVVAVIASCTSSSEMAGLGSSSDEYDSDQTIVEESRLDALASANQSNESGASADLGRDVLINRSTVTATESKAAANDAADRHFDANDIAQQAAAPAVLQESLAHMPVTKPNKRRLAEFEYPAQVENRENYDKIVNNRIVLTANQPTSTFSVDVDSGAYSNMRRFLNGGNLPPADAVRIEELINYFSYNYHTPDNQDLPFSITTELAPSPWNAKTHLLHVGLKGYEIEAADRPSANLVFLIDVSGSMGDTNKLGLLKPAMRMLSDKMTENDTISIVVYAGASGVVLEPTAGNDTAAISRAIGKLQAGGSTNGRAGIELAYDMAAKGFKKNGINRVILATDGDFNVGLSDVDALKSLIEQKRESGIALTTLGFGAGNYNDHLMEQLADVGNGAYAYIDNLNEARKVLADEVTSTLLTIAKDVKIQIEFNPAVVSEYRLIGYENRHLENEDFANDKIDAGEIGAGHTVTALYEIALVGDGGERHSPQRYGQRIDSTARHSDEIAELRLRYKAPDGDTSKLVSSLVMRDDRIDSDDTSDNFRFSAAVAALGQMLRDSSYMNGYSLDDVVSLSQSAKGSDEFGYRQEFTNLVRLAKTLGELRKADVNLNTSESNG